jgi:RNase P/RNase MRP subunit POP5
MVARNSCACQEGLARKVVADLTLDKERLQEVVRRKLWRLLGDADDRLCAWCVWRVDPKTCRAIVVACQEGLVTRCGGKALIITVPAEPGTHRRDC